MTHNRKPDVLPVKGASIAEALHALACLEGTDYQSPYVTAAYYRAVRSALERAAAEGEALRTELATLKQALGKFTPSKRDPHRCLICEELDLGHYSGPFAEPGTLYCSKYSVPRAPAPPKGSTP